MTRILAILGLIILIAILAVASWHCPWLLSDDGNSFLKNFVNEELLPVLGVIVTITLASSANLHLELNRLEDAYGEQFSEARLANTSYAIMLIVLFFIALVVVVLKPIIAHTPIYQAAFNSAAIVIIVLSLLALADLTIAVFEIPARRRIGNDNAKGGPKEG